MATEPIGVRAQLEDSSQSLLATHRGTLIVAAFEDLVYSGTLPSHYPISAMGRNPAAGTGFEDLWDYGGNHTEMTVAAAVYVSSSSASDVTAVKVTGLDANWAVQTVTQVLAGQAETLVGTTQTWIRVTEIENVGAAAYVGDVYCYLDDTVTAGVPQTAGKIQAKIVIGNGRSMCGRFTIPAGCTAYLKSFFTSISTAAATQVDLMVTPFGLAPYVLFTQEMYFNGAQMILSIPELVEAKSDLWLRGKNASSGAVAGMFQGWYEVS
jgi:hypothetical protein